MSSPQDGVILHVVNDCIDDAINRSSVDERRTKAESGDDKIQNVGEDGFSKSISSSYTVSQMRLLVPAPMVGDVLASLHLKSYMFKLLQTVSSNLSSSEVQSRKVGEENKFQSTVEMPLKPLSMFDYKQKSELRPVLTQMEKIQCSLCKVMVVILIKLKILDITF